MHFAGGRAATFARAVAFPNDGGAMGVHGDADRGGVDGEEVAAVFAGEYAFGLDRLLIPAVKAKDPIGRR